MFKPSDAISLVLAHLSYCILWTGIAVTPAFSPQIPKVSRMDVTLVDFKGVIHQNRKKMIVMAIFPIFHGTPKGQQSGMSPRR